jgi:phasin
MNDVSANLEANGNPGHANGRANDKQAFAGPLFELSKMVMSFAFCGFAEQGVRRAKESTERMHAVSEEMSGVLRESYLNSAKGAADYGLKVGQIVSANASSAFSFVGDLLTTKSIPEAMQLATAQARKNIEAASAQNAELLELAQRVASESAEPIRHGVGRTLQKV